MGDSMTCGEYLNRIYDLSSSRSVVLEDDRRVAYAYLLNGEDILSDVWLYNVESNVEEINWKDSSSLPFLNPAQFCNSLPVVRLAEASDIRCIWNETQADVFVNGVHLARLQVGVKPGWSRYCLKSGPLAKPLGSEI